MEMEELDKNVCCIKGCDIRVYGLGMCKGHYDRTKKYGSPVGHPTMAARVYRKSAPERFWDRVYKTESCWIWEGTKDRDGYGRYHAMVNGKLIKRAHRFAYATEKGPIPPYALVCHACDNPPCVNPDHLYLGDPATNMADRKERGHYRQPSGALVSNAILSDEKAREILKDPRPYRLIARDYGVTASSVGKVKNRLSWKHVEGQAVHYKRVSPMKGRSKNLNPEIVKDIRTSSETYSKLSQKYGVSVQTICDIRKGRSWRHVT
jgi:uncharacterized protein YerC